MNKDKRLLSYARRMLQRTTSASTRQMFQRFVELETARQARHGRPRRRRSLPQRAL